MSDYGWVVLDNLDCRFKDIHHFPQYEGGPTSWSQLVDFLETEDRYLVRMWLYYKDWHIPILPFADYYTFHHSIEIELTKKGQETRKYIVGTAVLGEKAYIYRLQEGCEKEASLACLDEHSQNIILMKPSPSAPPKTLAKNY